MKILHFDILEGFKKGGITQFENDNLNETYKIYLYKNKMRFDVDGKTIRFIMLDKNKAGQVITLEKGEASNEVLLPVTNELTKIDGVYNAQIIFTKPDGYNEKTMIFTLTIKNDLLTDMESELVSREEYQYLVDRFDEAVRDIETFKTEIRNEYSGLETVLNDKYNTFKTEVINSNNSFKNEIGSQVTNIENSINEIIKKSKNLFNKNNVTSGYYIDCRNGNLSVNNVYSASNYIEIKENMNYTINFYDQVAFYDSDKNYISGIDGYQLGVKTITTPKNSVFIRVSVYNNNIDNYQLEEGTESTDYEPYGDVLTDNFKEYIKNLIPVDSYKSVKSCFKKLSNSYLGGKKVTIKLIGDSITAGVGGTGYSATGGIIYDTYKINENGKCWANSFKSYIENKLNCEVLNFGVAGKDSTAIRLHINELVQDTDDIVICMIGTNNRQNTTKNKLYSDLIEIYKNITSRGKEIILMSSIPASIVNETTGTRNFHMEDVDITISCVASTLNVEYISIYKLFIEYCKTRNITIDSLLADGLHPNDSGYDVMFYLICNALGFGVKIDGATW